MVKRIPNLRQYRVAAAVALAAAGGMASIAKASDDPAFGYWLTESKRAIVEVAACEGAPDRACGSIVWMLDPTDETGQPRRDTSNPEEGLRSRALCGLAIVGDFERAKPGEWEEGFIYDPVEGDTYSAWMEAQSSEKLRVRGYVGVSLLGSTQIWTREASNRGGC